MTVTETGTRLNDEQLEATEATGNVFVSAGAGTGKTSVLVERYVRAVCERGLDVESILVITYTRKAAGELRSRIRSALVARDRPDLARELDGAWISTIHGFCNRLLKAHPFSVGLDPRFRELDDAGAAVLRGEAFERALEIFCSNGEPERLRLLATYRAVGLRRMLIGVYETLRSAGRELVLELGARPSFEEALGDLRREAACLAQDEDATATQRSNATEALRLAGLGDLRREASCLVQDEDATATQRGNATEALLSPAKARPPSASSIWLRSKAGARARRRTSMRARRSSSPRSKSSPPPIATFSRSCSSASRRSTRRRSVASRSSTSKISSSPRETSFATTLACGSRCRLDSDS